MGPRSETAVTEPGLVEDYHSETARDRHLPESIVIWDETLRDGEQTPGVHFTPEEKLRIAEKLAGIGVGVLNAGIPVVSPEEARAVRLLATAGLKSKVLAAARTVPADVEAVIDSGVTHIAIFVAASNVHLKYKLKMSPDEVVAASVRSVRRAKEAGLHVSFVTEDTVRAPFDFVERLYGAVQKEGADRLVVADTVGVMTPLTFRWYLSEFHPAGASDGPVGPLPRRLRSRHREHVDRSGVRGPCAPRLRERARRASWECCAGGGRSRPRGALRRTGRGSAPRGSSSSPALVEELSGVPIAANKASSGYNAFSHEAGIHTHGILANTLTYEPIQPGRCGPAPPDDPR